MSYDNYQALFNQTTYNIDASDLIFSGLTANSLIYSNSSNSFASATVGSNLTFSAGTLNLVTSPSVTGLTVGTLNGILYGNSGVLTAATIGSNLTFSAGTIDTIQAITTASSPMFAGLTVNTLIVGNQFSVDCIANFYRNYTALGVSCINAAYVGTLTTSSGTGFRNAFGLYCGNSFASNTSNDTLVLHNIFSYPSFDATNASIAYAYGIYSAISGITGNVDNAYSLYVAAPPSGGINRAAILTDNLVVGAAGNPPTNGILVSGAIKNTGLTASSLVYSDASYQLSSVTMGLNLSLTTGTLDTIDSPGFTSLTLSGTPLGYASGGTGQNSYAAGDFIYASAINTLAKRTIGTAGQVLTVVAGVPDWTTLASAGVTSITSGNSNIVISPSSGAVVATMAAGLSGLSYVTSDDLYGNTKIVSSGYVQAASYIYSSGYAETADYLKVGSYMGVGISASFNRTFYCSRSYTATSSSAYGATYGGTVTAQAGAITPALYGLSISNTLASSTGNLTPSLFYGLYCDITTNATNAAITTAIGSRFNLTTSGTTSYGYSTYITAPTGTVGLKCALFAEDAQIGFVGDIIATGSGKSGFLYVDQRVSISGQANSIDRCITCARTYTATTTTPYIYNFASNYTLLAGASANTAYGMRVADSFVSNTSNTANTITGLGVENNFNGTPDSSSSCGTSFPETPVTK